MIELIQFPWSPFCIPQRRILEFAGVPFKITNIPPQERTLVWKLTRQRYYGVPIIRDGKNVIFEINEDSQVVAKYLNEKFQLGLFPAELRGVQSILWRFIENEMKARPSGSTTFTTRKTRWRPIICNICGSRNASSDAAASSNGSTSKNSGSNGWRQAWFRSNRCCCTSRSCSMNAHASWILICSGCSKTFFTPATTSCPRAINK
jgi:hypothetical protein